MTNDFIAGCSSGIIQTLIGHPFDTLKVLMQTNKTLYKTPLHYYKVCYFHYHSILFSQVSHLI